MVECLEYFDALGTGEGFELCFAVGGQLLQVREVVKKTFIMAGL